MPMRLLLTGLNGTLAPHVAQAARAGGGAGATVLGWDRRAVDPEDTAAAEAWLEAQAPTAIAHLATGSAAWAGRLAAFAARHGLPLLHCSSAMVFDHVPDGPHHPHDARTARDDYGRYKVACEDAVLAAHPAAMVVRIGWQIDPVQPGNNMLMALDQWQAREGCVAASRRWRPACSFMADTAAAFVALLRAPSPGVFHLDSNARDGHSFAQIAAALRSAFGREAWQIREHDDYVHDQRLLGGPAHGLPPLAERLPALRTLVPPP